MSAAPDLSRFGEIVTKPDFLFPYKPTSRGKFANIPYPEYPDPLGSGKAAIDFLGNFKMSEGRAYGTPVNEAMAPFQRRGIAALFGYRDPITGTRYFRSGDFIATRKSAKTWFAGAVGTLFLFSGQEPANEILIVATSQKQARRTYNLVLGMIRTNDRYFGECRIQEHMGMITHIPTGNVLHAAVADAKKIWGTSPGVIIADEMHAWEDDRGHALWQSLITGQGARRNPLVLTTTTVPEKPLPPDSVFMERLRYSMEVMRGERQDPRHLPMVWLTPDDADISDPKVWKRVNPGLGYSLDLTEIQEEYERALAAGERSLRGFATMRLNQIPKTSMDLGWLNPDSVARARRAVDLDEFEDCVYRCAGLDLGGSWDMCSFTLLGVMPDDTVISRQLSFLCNAAYQRFKDKVPLDNFIERGELQIAGDEAVPDEHYIAELLDWCDAADIGEIAIDPAMSPLVVPQLEAGGLEVVLARQGTLSMSAPMSYIEGLLDAGNLAIGDDALFEWCLNNTGQLSNSTGRKPCKLGNDSSSNPNKVDATSALLSGAQLVLEARQNGMTSATGDTEVTEWVCPYSAPMDYSSVDDGGTPIGGMLDMFGEGPKVDPTTGAWKVYYD